jgi:hypothetical protein
MDGKLIQVRVDGKLIQVGVSEKTSKSWLMVR